MRMHFCGCPALLADGSTDFGPRIVGESGVWDQPCVSFAPDEVPLPLYQHGKHLDYRANKLSMKCACLARNWDKFKSKLPSLPGNSLFIPSTNDFHFVNYRLQYLPERHPNPKMHLKDGPLLDRWSQLPICADFHHRYRAPLGGPRGRRPRT
ncbi:uncharacterized protein LOC117641993 [Thrips palmi]|uniref:Uncharacterized protein LOC117641993 n=1 Tax=Thrips palmi TaxID=161013 RepID=A0A6P8YF95_THRPL|nr:uncharacterized protein LOC117641993 [Thrips palmi]